MAFGHIGSYYYNNPNIDVNKSLLLLKNVDWSRDNLDCWKGHAIREDGKVNTGETAVILISNKLKQILGIPLTKDELKKEKLI